MTKRAALYARISEAEIGVDKTENQLAELRGIAEASGYSVVHEFVDDDISAFEGKNDRPGFVGLISAIQAGTVDVVMATEPQRFTRGSSAELEALQIACVRAGAVLHTRLAGVQDPATSMVAAMMKLQDTFAWLEVATNRERQRARIRADRAKGIPMKGLRPVGWEPGGVTLRASEAGIIKDALTLARQGVSLSAIAHFLNESGLRTDSMGKPRQVRGSAKGVKKLSNTTWTITTTRQLLTRDRNAGLLDGKPSTIEPIITPNQLEEIKLAIKGKLPQGPKTQSLLGGIMRCHCGETMTSTEMYSQRKGGKRYVYRIYRCRMVGYDKSQKHPSITESAADDFMRTQTLGALGLWRDNLDDDSSANVGDLRIEVARIRDQIVRQQELYGVEGVELGPIKATITKLGAQRDELETEITKALADSASLGSLVTAENIVDEYGSPKTLFDGTEFLEAWAGWDTDRKRAIIRRLFTGITLYPGKGTDRLWATPFMPPTAHQQDGG